MCAPCCPFIDEKMEAPGVGLSGRSLVLLSLFLVPVGPAHPFLFIPLGAGVDCHVGKASLSLLGSPGGTPS